eukprot:416227-Rhodomonas_salina.3
MKGGDWVKCECGGDGFRSDYVGEEDLIEFEACENSIAVEGRRRCRFRTKFRAGQLRDLPTTALCDAQC